MVAVLVSTHVDITPQAAWSTSESAVLTVSPSGGAAHAPGTATVLATYQDRTVATPVVVMPAGTFRLEVDVRGMFDALLPGAQRPVSASVEVIAGVGAGQLASFVIGDDLPAYVLYGIVGPVTISISAAGFVSQTVGLTVRSHMRQQILLSEAPAGASR